jgi:uncharacterized protein YbjT (DUF2867 family)
VHDFASKAAIERVLAASNVPHIVVAPTLWVPKIYATR